VLEKEIREPYTYQRGHLTPMGLFELIAEHPDDVIVLDDLAAVLDSDIALQILLSALEHPVPGDRTRSRVVEYKRQGREERVSFRGGIICISNRVLHDDDLLGAFKSRVNIRKYDPSDAQLGALMLGFAELGWPLTGRPEISPEEARAVAHFLIGEMLRLGCSFDLRLFVDKALPSYQQWKDDEAESDWRDLVTASIEEHLVSVRHEDGRPSRAERKQGEYAVIREILRDHETREERLRAWTERTGKSERAFYRRLADLSDTSEKCQSVNPSKDAGTDSMPGGTRDDRPRWLGNGFARHQLDDGSPFYHGRLPGELLWDGETFEKVWRLRPALKPRILMHGREVEIPRWQQAYGADYHFSGQTSRALPVPAVLVPLLDWAKRAIDPNLNGLLLNWYDGPDHYIGPHHDATNGLIDGAPIVTISFGETRTFRLSQGSGDGRRVRDFPAPPGAVFILPRETNQAWKHAVPRSVQHRGRRVSVTLRAFADALPDS
jgi:alkylated DNA repair dioxygenase AlkB